MKSERLVQSKQFTLEKVTDFYPITERYQRSYHYLYMLRALSSEQGDEGLTRVIDDLSYYLQYTNDGSKLREKLLNSLKEIIEEFNL